MSKQDWLDYFEVVNGRSDSAEEIAQALAAGEFQEEVVVPETPQALEFVAAPTAPVEETSCCSTSSSQRPLLKQRHKPPEFVAAPTAPLKNQSQLHCSRVCRSASSSLAAEFVAAPVQQTSFCSSNCSY